MTADNPFLIKKNLDQYAIPVDKEVKTTQIDRERERKNE